MAVFTVNSFDRHPQPARRRRHAPLGDPGRQQLARGRHDQHPLRRHLQDHHGRRRTDNSAGELAIADAGDLTIQNTSGGGVTIDGGGLNRVFDVDPAASTKPFTVTLRGLTITGGVAPDPAAGIGVQGGRAHARHTTVTGNVAGVDGGGIAMETGGTGALTLLASQVASNLAMNSGGGIADAGTGLMAIGRQVVDRRQRRRSSTAAGSASSTPRLAANGSAISGNRALRASAARSGNAGSGAVALVGSIIEGNSAAGTGGGYAERGPAALVASRQLLPRQRRGAPEGGGISRTATATSVTGTTIAGNFAALGGGGLESTSRQRPRPG